MKTETFIKQVPVAIAAIGQHMHEHQLPITTSIDVYPHSQEIRVRVDGGEAGTQAWLNSLAIDGEENEQLSSTPRGIRTTWQVRLPDLGIRFELIAYRAQPLLTAVSA